MTDLVLSFVTCDDMLSALIREKSPMVSHAEFVLPDGRRLGAHMDGGIQARAPDYEKFTADFQVTVETEKAEAVYAGALARVGTPYDWAAILGFVFNDDLHLPQHMICSAFVTSMLLDHGVLSDIPQAPHQVSPYALLLLASQRGRWRKVI